jgi:hypothetical protein
VLIAGDLQFLSGCKVILSRKWVAGLRFLIQKRPVRFLLMMKAEESGEIWIDDSAPLSVQLNRRLAVRARHNDRCRRSLSLSMGKMEKEECLDYGK